MASPLKAEVKETNGVSKDVAEKARLFIETTSNDADPEAVGNLVCQNILNQGAWNFVCVFRKGDRAHETPNRFATNIQASKSLAIKNDVDHGFYYFFTFDR